MGDTKKYPHAGHRQRVKKRFMITGLTGFHDYEALELLLFFAIPRRDVKPMAHELIRRFGNLQRVMDAPTEELLEVPGIGPRAVELLHFVPSFIDHFLRSMSQCHAQPIRSPQELLNHMSSRLLCLQSPALFLLPLNRVGDAISIQRLREDAASLSPGFLLNRAGTIASAVMLLEATDKPLDEMYTLREPMVRALAEQMAILQFPLMDFCLWSLASRELVSFRAYGSLPQAVIPSSFQFD